MWVDPWGLAGVRLPRSNGSWSGEPGESNWYSDNPWVNKVTNNEPIPFTDGKPDFSQWSKGKLTFPNGQLNGTSSDFKTVYQKIGEQRGITPNAAKNLLKQNGLTPHHYSSTEIQLVPTDLHANVPHIGSASAMRRNAKC